MKILLLGAELFHAEGQSDGQTHRHYEANVTFRKFDVCV